LTVIRHVFEAGDALFPTSNPAAPILIQGTNFPISGLAFDPTTTESVFFTFPAIGYGDTPQVKVEWYADTATSGGISFDIAVACITPNTDTQDIETKALSSHSNNIDTHLGTTGQRLHTFTIELFFQDSLAANDHVVLLLQRNTGDSFDDLTGDVIVTRAIFLYNEV